MSQRETQAIKKIRIRMLNKTIYNLVANSMKKKFLWIRKSSYVYYLDPSGFHTLSNANIFIPIWSFFTFTGQ